MVDDQTIGEIERRGREIAKDEDLSEQEAKVYLARHTYELDRSEIAARIVEDDSDISEIESDIHEKEREHLERQMDVSAIECKQCGARFEERLPYFCPQCGHRAWTG